MKNFDRNFKRTSRVIGAGAIITIVLSAVIFIGSIFLVVYVVGEIREHGLKGIVEDIWEGEGSE